MINDSETRQLSSEHNLLRAAKRYLQDGAVHAGGEARRIRGHARATSTASSAFQRSRWRSRTTRRERAIRFARRLHGLFGERGEHDDAALRRAMVYGSVLGSFRSRVSAWRDC